MRKEIELDFDVDENSPTFEADKLIEVIDRVNREYEQTDFDEEDNRMLKGYYLLEIAKDVAIDIENIFFRARLAEEQKENPDLDKIARIRKKEDELYEEGKQMLSSKDKERMIYFINKYGMILRARYRKITGKLYEMDDFKLTPEQHEVTFRKLEEKMLSRSAPSSNPTIVLIGGQPGAGKSFLETHIKETVFAGDKEPVVINSNSYRSAHPRFDEIIEKDDKQIYGKTEHDAGKWKSELLASAVKNRRNITLQGTLANDKNAIRQVKELKAEGYRVQVAVLAVNSEISRLGVLLRYEESKQKKGYGRYVTLEAHDAYYKAMPDAIRSIERNAPIDCIEVYDRDRNKLYHNERNAN